jgi:hypothetical protein
MGAVHLGWCEMLAGHEAGHAVVAWRYGAYVDPGAVAPFTVGDGTEADVPQDTWTGYIGAASDILSRKRRQWDRLCTRLLTAGSLSWREAVPSSADAILTVPGR